MASNLLSELSYKFSEEYRQKKILLTFDEFLKDVEEKPRSHLRNSADYLLDAVNHSGSYKIQYHHSGDIRRFKIFDLGTTRNGAIIGGELAQNKILNIVQNFVDTDYISKLILLQGPNGSGKSSTIETLTQALEEYSYTEQGNIYRFNWVFPKEEDKQGLHKELTGPIGFSSQQKNSNKDSFALLPSHKLSSRITSEFKENPLYLLPIVERENFLKAILAKKEAVSPSQVKLPQHILRDSLSKTNRLIFEALLQAYQGKLDLVLRHIQVERFFFSKKYRVGISSVDPQMSIDAREQQLTMKHDYARLPAALQSLSFYQLSGELVEANRGILEFSDLLKRPLESFKYLINTIENNSINLGSSTASLDLLFFASTNDKLFDAFKTSPEFSSFKGRCELVTAPYVLMSSEEEKIYKKDLSLISQKKKVAPHSLEVLCLWSVMTRLKQAELAHYEPKYHELLGRLTPYLKTLLYNGSSLQPDLSLEEESTLREILPRLWQESQGSPIYEGRFGASPREIRSILYQASNHDKFNVVTPFVIFSELDNLVKDRTLYEFLQYQPKAGYHDVASFTSVLKGHFVRQFEKELIHSMSLAHEDDYEELVQRYIDHVVTSIRKEELWEKASKTFKKPSEDLMTRVESFLQIKKAKIEHRESILHRIASFQVENPDSKYSVRLVFPDYLAKIENHYHNEQKVKISDVHQAMLELYKQTPHKSELQKDDFVEPIYQRMKSNYAYDRATTYLCLKDVLKFNKERQKMGQSKISTV